MAKKSKKWLIITAIILAVSALAAIGYAYIRLSNERDTLSAELDKTQRRAELLQGKYAEERARANGLIRVKTSLEGTIRSLQGDMESLKAEKAAVLAEKEGLEETYKKKTDVLEAKIEALLARVETVKKSRDEVVARYKEKVGLIRDQEDKIVGLTNDLKRADFEVKRVGKQLDNCKEHNERLCLITEELVEKYKNKGVVGSLMVTEPFTKLEKVEVERLIQEYTEKIDKERIE